jgi:chromate transport protein ChrA
MKRLSKKGYSLEQLPFLAIVFGVAIIVLAIVAQIVGQVKTTQTANSAEANISTLGLQGIQSLGNWLPTIGLILGAIIIIVALTMLFMYKFKQE